MLYVYGFKLGLRLLFKGKLKEALKYLIIPVNYWRNIEYYLVYSNSKFFKGAKILDIGSPKLFSIFLADEKRMKVLPTDINEYFLKEIKAIKSARQMLHSNLNPIITDGRKLAFKSNAVDLVYSISVVEHIPGKGDSDCMKEIGRVLSKRGRCIITVPFSKIHREEYKNPKNVYWFRAYKSRQTDKVFYQRRYDEKELFRRLIKPSGLTLKNLIFVGEKIIINESQDLGDVLPIFLGPLHIFFSSIFHQVTHDSREGLKNPRCAVLVLQKEG